MGGEAAGGGLLAASSFYVALFRDAPGMVGRLIRWQTRSRYSHAALVFDRELIYRIDPSAHLFFEREKQGNGFAHCQTCSLITIEAREFRGVRITEGVVRDERTKVDLFAINTDDAEGAKSAEAAEKIWYFAKDQIAKSYDYTMVARFVSRRQASRGESDKWFCSELVFAALRRAGIELLRDVEPWAVSPGLLAKSPLLKLQRTIG